MVPLRVLISGASVAGPALAYWLVRAGCKVTIVERSPTLRLAGQGIDVRDQAREVIRRMHIFDTLRDRSSKEEGIKLVDAKNKTLARFPVDLESGDGDSPTCDIEILRGELAKVLVDLTKDDVKYVFGDSIDSLQETNEQVTVGFANGTPTTSYDLVVAADGMGSKTRSLAFSPDDVHIRSFNAYVSYFSVKPTQTDSMWARVHWFKGGRNVAVRPDNQGRTRAFLTMTAYTDKDPRLAQYEKASRQGVQAQKDLTQQIFQDADWEIERLLKGMHDADDYYMQHVAQVRMKRWSNGRVALLGDAGYAPSPFTGMGTSIAFIGAYVLAGEISKQPDNIPAALQSYEKVLKPYVESVQKVAPGIPWIVNPQSALGVKILETVARGVQLITSTWISTAIQKLANLLPIWNDDFVLPKYPAFEDAKEQ